MLRLLIKFIKISIFPFYGECQSMFAERAKNRVSGSGLEKKHGGAGSLVDRERSGDWAESSESVALNNPLKPKHFKS